MNTQLQKTSTATAKIKSAAQASCKTMLVQEQFVYSTKEEVLDAAKLIMESMITERNPLTSPDLVRDYLKIRIGKYEHEVFTVLFLDNQNRLIKAEDMFRGTIDGASIYPREVAKAALQCNAAALIFAHNHPSGNVEPSQADKVITRRLQSAMDLLDINVLDHIIVSASGSLSFAERGLL
jgi:DNA repair protein RadC